MPKPFKPKPVEYIGPCESRDSSGMKFDEGKAQYSLIPFKHLEGVARVREYGVLKYKDPDGWKTVENAKKRYTDALLRHLFAWLAGEDKDQESGLPHLDHALCNMIFLKEFDL